MQEVKAKDVVEVHVGLQSKDGMKSIFFDEMGDFILLSFTKSPTIDDDSLEGFIPYNVTVLPYGIRYKALDIQWTIHNAQFTIRATPFLILNS